MAEIDRSTGRVIVLNGTSSAGKTTLAATLRDRFAEAGECWIVLGLDDTFGKLPFAFVRYGKAHIGAHAERGIAFEMIDGELVRRLGPVGEQAMAAYRGGVASAARAGLNVLVDEVLLSEDDWAAWQAELAGLDVRWVRVDADLEVLEARERARGDRLVGLARAQHGVVHRYPAYAAEVDTGRLDPDEAAAAVARAVAR
jgi:chloramphenicol 3-O phosphotransferase